MNTFLMLGIATISLLLVVLIAAAASLPAMQQIPANIEPSNKEPSS